jgi:hypothetical protein
MGLIKFTTSEKMDKVIGELCNKLGWKKSELGRQALNEYLKDYIIKK